MRRSLPSILRTLEERGVTIPGATDESYVEARCTDGCERSMLITEASVGSRYDQGGAAGDGSARVQEFNSGWTKTLERTVAMPGRRVVWARDCRPAGEDSESGLSPRPAAVSS